MPLFSELNLHPQLLKALEKLEFTEATDVQAGTIPAALDGQDLMVSARTGSGKTAAFVLPMLDRLLQQKAPNSGTRALILLPTRELAQQTRKMFEKLAAFTLIKCDLIMGGEAYKHQVASLRRNPEVLIATPGRLVEHLEKGNIDFKDLEILVLDEADRMLDMGFTEAMATIARACNPDRQTLLFSATLDHQGLSAVRDWLKSPVSIEIDSHRQAHRHITQQRVFVDDDKHKQRIIAALVEQEQARRTIVFCNTRAQCQQLGASLSEQGLRVGYLHGEIAQSIRKQVMSRFHDGKTDVLVATDVAARGLDIAEVDLVINYTVAHSGDEHVHRVGRTGRAGQGGLAVTLVNSLEYNRMSSIERYLKIRFEPRAIAGLEAQYQGPKKVKKSGKAVGPKRRKDATAGKAGAKAKAKPKPKAKHAKRKAASVGRPKPRPVQPAEPEGMQPLRRKT